MSILRFPGATVDTSAFRNDSAPTQTTLTERDNDDLLALLALFEWYRGPGERSVTVRSYPPDPKLGEHSVCLQCDGRLSIGCGSTVKDAVLDAFEDERRR